MTFGVIAATALVPLLMALASRRPVLRSVERVRPALAVRLLAAYALVVSLATGAVLCLTAYLGTVRVFPGLHPRDWGVTELRTLVPIPPVLAITCGALAIVLLLNAGRHLVTVTIGFLHAADAVRRLPSSSSLVVVDDESVGAFAVLSRAGTRPGRIVVSAGLMRELTPTQRRALIAHEFAHLRRHHHLYRQCVALAVAANPMLHPVSRQMDLALERWADEEAAVATSPVAVAHAISHAARYASSTAPSGALGASGSNVVARVRWLLEPPRATRTPAIGLVVAVVACCVSTLLAVRFGHTAVELAEASLPHR